MFENNRVLGITKICHYMIVYCISGQFYCKHAISKSKKVTTTKFGSKSFIPLCIDLLPLLRIILMRAKWVWFFTNLTRTTYLHIYGRHQDWGIHKDSHCIHMYSYYIFHFDNVRPQYKLDKEKWDYPLKFDKKKFFLIHNFNLIATF